MDPASFGLPAVAHSAQQQQFQTGPVHTAFIDPASLPFARLANYPLVQPVNTAHVDYRNFCPYAPNEVRHRKRTSRAQLKVLEETFRTDQKPNPTARKALATQLNMTARAVQVWFQNRRAKDKNLAKKASLAQQNASGSTTAPGSASDTDAAQPSPTSDSHSVPPATPIQSSRESNSPGSPVGSEDSQDTPGEASHPNASLVTPGPSPKQEDGVAHDLPIIDRDGSLESRRSSLPTPTNGPAPMRIRNDSANVMVSRRKSLEMNLQRLASHPYAPVVAAAAVPNGPATFSRIQQSGSPHSFHRNRANLRLDTDVPSRSILAHRGSVPAYPVTTGRLVGHSPSHSVPATATAITPPTLLTTRVTGTHYSNMFAPRLPSAPPVIPGPLPAADFSFGNPISGHRDRDSDTDSRLAQFRDSEEDSPAVGPFSRFGSLASDVTTASTSTFVSDFGTDAPDIPRGWMADERRASCPDHFVKMLSSLDVAEGSSDYFDASGQTSHHYPLVGHMGTPVTPYSNQTYSLNEQPPTRTRSELEFALHMTGMEPRKPGGSPLRTAVTPTEAGSHVQQSTSGLQHGNAELGSASSAHVSVNASASAAANNAAASAASSVSSLGIVTPLDLPTSFGHPGFELGQFMTHAATNVSEGDTFFSPERAQQHAQACYSRVLDPNAMMNTNYGCYP